MTGRLRPEHGLLVALVTLSVLVAGSLGSGAPPQANAATTGPTDILLLLDTTASMDEALSASVERIQAIKDRLDTSIDDVGFAVAEVRDYDAHGLGDSGDVPFSVVQPVTTDISAVTDALDSLEADGGGDSPEAYGRALDAARKGNKVGWRDGSRRMIIVVADDVPHDDDLNEGVPGEFQLDEFDGNPDPGPDMEFNTDDDVDWQEILDDLAVDGIPIMYLLFEGEERYLPFWRIWASRTGGAAALGSEEDLEDRVVDLARKGAIAVMPACPRGMTRKGSWDRTCIQDFEVCPDVAMIGARGSGDGWKGGKAPKVSEMKVGGQVGAFSKMLEDSLKAEGLRYDSRPVIYPAVPVLPEDGKKLDMTWWNVANLVDAKSPHHGMYDKSVRAGKEDMWRQVKEMLDTCGRKGITTRVVLSGHSQGAQVAGDVLAEKVSALPDEKKRRVMGILFADPKMNHNDKETSRGWFWSVPLAQGAVGLRGSIKSPPKVFSFCRFKDLICGGGPGFDHSDYKSFEAAWAANLISNQVAGASKHIGLKLKIGDPYMARGAWKVPVRVKSDQPGTVFLRSELKSKYGRDLYADGRKMTTSGGETDVDLTFSAAEIHQVNEGLGVGSITVIRLPSLGPGATLKVQAWSSAADAKETKAEAVGTVVFD